MNHMKQIAEMFDIEFGEVFYLKENGNGNIKPCRYKFTAKNMYVYNELDETWSEVSGTLVSVLRGDISIVKKPWEPDSGEAYYYLYYTTDEKSADVFCGRYSHNSYPDVLNVRLGNCFKTKEEAEKHQKTFTEWMKGNSKCIDWKEEK